MKINDIVYNIEHFPHNPKALLGLSNTYSESILEKSGLESALEDIEEDTMIGL